MAMKVKIKIYGPLRRYVAETEGEYNVEDAKNIYDILLKIGIPENELVYTVALLNGERVKLGTQIKDGDELYILQPVGGG